MKHVKKLTSLLLVLILVLGLATTALAADGDEEATVATYDIVINNDAEGHTYEAYQIFAGDLSEDEKTLSNIRWGSGVTEAGQAAYGEAENKADSLTSQELVNAFADDLVTKQYLQNPVSSQYAEGKYTISGLTAGYYLVMDKADSLDGKDDVYTAYILKVVQDETVTPKSVKPSVDKKVYDEADPADPTAGEDGFGETADHAINESFQFQLIATLPASENYAAYETYTVKFTDTMSKGLTFEKIDSVTVDGVPVTNYDCTAEADTKGEATWMLTIEDIKAIDGIDLSDGESVVVTYSAHLNEEATVGATNNNFNKVYLEYSNNPNAGGSGDLGKTSEDTVWVFTYDVQNVKRDGTSGETEDAPILAGAGFRLYDEAGTVEIPLIFDETLNAYRPVKGDEQAEEMFSAEETGIFNIVGLDVGTYTLKETTTPDGYNTCEDIKVVINAEHSENPDGASATVVITAENTENTIYNKKGATLPETGGIGTTIFYILGGVLVVGAVVLLVTKKRMGAEQ